MKLNEAVKNLSEFAGSLGMMEQAAVIDEAATLCKLGKPGEAAKRLVDILAGMLVEIEAKRA